MVDDKAIEWETQERVKPPWIKSTVHYSERIPPQKDQKSNNDLTNEQVLQPRDEPIGNSQASPLNGRGQIHGAVESSRSKQIQSDSGARGLG